jgi:hypothetical protein
MNLIHIVRAKGGTIEPDDIILGVYPTEAQAQNRCEFIKESLLCSFKYVWYQVVDMDADGGDCYLSNR